MPVTTKTPVTNQDFMNAGNFVVVVEKFNNIAFFTDAVDIPGISLNHPEQPNPFANLHRVADRIQYDTLSLSFRVNEDLSNWNEIYAWMVGATFPEDYPQYIAATSPSEKEKVLFTTITVTILNNYKKPLKNITFYDCLPTALSGFTMTTSDSSIEPVNSNVTFVFTHFKVENLV